MSRTRDIPLKYYRALVAFYECGGHQPASEFLNISQPTLSYRLQELSNSLRTELFHKVGRANQLTQEGEYVLLSARAILKLNDKMVKELASKTKRR